LTPFIPVSGRPHEVQMEFATPARSALAMPLDRAIAALRNLPPGTALREPETPDLRLLAEAVRAVPDGRDVTEWLWQHHPSAVSATVLRTQLAALSRAIVGASGAVRESDFAPEAGSRLAGVANSAGGRWRSVLRRSDAVAVLDYLREDADLCEAVAEWADTVDYGALAHALRSTGLIEDPSAGRGVERLRMLRDDELRLATTMAVAAQVPSMAGELNLDGVVAHRQAVVIHEGEPGVDLVLDSVAVGDWGFAVTVVARAPEDIDRTGTAISIRSIRWNGLARITDDLGHEYLILDREHYPLGADAGQGKERVVHWCYPKPHPDATSLSVESAGHRVESMRFDTVEEAWPTRSTTQVGSDSVLKASLIG
jgi:hypothetical protein